jgi:hypothetical protein
MKINIPTPQYEYLSANLSKEQESLFKKFEAGRGSTNSFDLDEDLLYTIRDWANEKILKVGFDQNYNLTAEGAILESIVDTLYI